MPEFANKTKIQATILRETAMASLCDVGAKDGKPIWIPKSQIDDDSEVWKVGDSGEMTLNEWFAEQKGLI